MRPPLSYLLAVRVRRVWCRISMAWRFAAFGAGSLVERPLLIVGHRNISIGDGTSVRAGARIEAHPRFPHRTPVLTIGSQTNIEQHVHIMCQSRIVIGDRVSVTGQCAIVDVTHPIDLGVGKIGDAIVDEDTYVEIGDDVFIGYGSVILPNVRIGTGAVIGANSVVTADVPDHAIAAGVPARIIGHRQLPHADEH